MNIQRKAHAVRFIVCYCRKLLFAIASATLGHERLAGKLASDRDPRAILNRQ
jgi:hypothetical protein